MASERVLVIVGFDHRLLLGRMNRTRLSKNGTRFPWGFPGGKRRGGVRRSQPELLVRAAKRELWEEVHKHLSTRRFFYLGHFYDEEDDRTYHIFRVELTLAEFHERIPPHHEFVEFKWFPNSVEQLPWGEMLPRTREWAVDFLALPYNTNTNKRTEPLQKIIKKKPAT